MKTIYQLLASTLLIILIGDINLHAQSPQKFNYQAVVRNTDGTVIASQSIGVQVSILKDSPTGSTVYTETHTSSTTSLGMITLEIGSGGDFSTVDWGSGEHYLKIEVDPAGGTAYQDMGTPTQLLSVPYALYSGKSSPQQLQLDGSTLTISDGNQVILPTVGTSHWTIGAGDTTVYRVSGNIGIGTDLPAGKLEVMGDGDESDDDALFEVKRSDGQTVFAVYPTGVQVFVEDIAGKGAKGGFAVGGFGSLGKGFTNEFLRVTPDSVRIYIDQASAKGAKGGFAIGGIGSLKGPLNDFMRITPDNYFIGQESGASITDGLYNSFMGFQSGKSTSSGDANIFLGYQSGFTNIDGYTNTFIGNSAGFMNENGYSNVFIGDSVGFNSNANWNIFIGNNAGYKTTTGAANVAIGDEAGYSNDDGWYNVFIGDLAGYSNIFGSSNVFIGSDAGFLNDSGSYNVFLGESAGWSNTSGSNNVFLGESSGYSNITGESNVFLGTEAGSSNTEGSWNVFMGDQAGYTNETGEDNIFIGAEAGFSNIDGDFNVFIGTSSGNSNTDGNYNVFLGDESGLLNETGISNVLIGLSSGQSNLDGNYNVCLGTLSGQGNTSGEQNVYLGQEAGYSNLLGSYNVAIGSQAGFSNTDSNNTFLGHAAGYLNVGGARNIFIGNGAGYEGTGYNGKTSDMFIVDNDYNTWDESFIYGEIDSNYLYFYADVDIAGAVYADVWGASDINFKSDIRPINNALQNVIKLNGVTYTWNPETTKGKRFTQGQQIGLIAQEVEAVFPELVKTQRGGDKAVNYSKLTAVLIEAIKEQQVMIEDLKQKVENLESALK